MSKTKLSEPSSLDLASVKQFENLELLARQLVEGFITGLHKSPYHGFSVEFAEHKLYNYGESTRHVDWKLFARTDRLYTKQYEEETNLRANIVIDTSSSMYYPLPGKDKIKFSIFSAAALSYLLITQRDAVGLTAFSSDIDVQTVQRSTKTHLSFLLKELHKWLDQPAGESSSTRIDEVLHHVADKIPRRSLVIIFSDLFQQATNLDRVFEALQHLKHNKHEVLLFHVTDHHSERLFDFQDRPYQFIDLETNQSVKVNPALIKERYQEKMSDFYREIKLGCGKLKIDFIEVDSSDPFDKILGAYLIKRKKMR
ncbi:MAG: DUF58 domain-containing protein [Cyclobacteriaceae bacterium]|nr:DUF58 domain-containing protein [Cyclobacteriaceae bacterium HetDA_MAG_MS6]